MKKLLFAAALVLVGISASAQIKVGAGYLNNTIKAKESGVSVSIDGNGFYLGAAYEQAIGFNEATSYEVGAYVDYIKFKAAGESESVVYLRVPVQAKYSVPVGYSSTVFAAAGPSFVLGLGGEDKPFDDGGLKRFDIQIGAAIGVKMAEKYEVKAGYDYGILKAMDADIKNHRGGFFVGVAYNF